MPVLLCLATIQYSKTCERIWQTTDSIIGISNSVIYIGELKISWMFLVVQLSVTDRHSPGIYILYSSTKQKLYCTKQTSVAIATAKTMQTKGNDYSLQPCRSNRRRRSDNSFIHQLRTDGWVDPGGTPIFSKILCQWTPTLWQARPVETAVGLELFNT